MAEYKKNVVLGFEQDLITDRYSDCVNFTTDKIGGIPVSIHVLKHNQIKYK